MVHGDVRAPWSAVHPDARPEGKGPGARVNGCKGGHDLAPLQLFLAAVLGPAAPPPALARVLRGDERPEDAELADAVRWVDREVLGRPPHRRPAAAAVAARCDRIRALLGGDGAPALALRDGGAEVALPDGATLRLSGASRRIVAALADAHARGPDAALSVWDLVEVGWPGERMRATSATNRAYVTVTRLRGAGLGPWIERVEGGYRLSPSLSVTRG